MKKNSLFAFVFALSLSTFSHAQKWTENKTGNISFVTNTNGRSLGYSTLSGVKLIIVDGFAFKDLNKNDKLDKYEDWRLSSDVRAKDLASKMSVE